jgi:hypothetical protein
MSTVSTKYLQIHVTNCAHETSLNHMNLTKMGVMADNFNWYAMPT